MNLIIILCAVALALGFGIIFIKIAKFIAEKGESITKILFAVSFVLVGLACVAYFWPEAAPMLTKSCEVVSEAIKGFVKPFIGA